MADDIEWVWASIQDGCADGGARERYHQVDGQLLWRKLRDLPYAGKLAVVDVAERFWARSDEGRKVMDVVKEGQSQPPSAE
jgi:hypothetical protein